jgi:hypothetical protein
MLAIAGVPPGSVITKVGSHPTPDLEAMVQALSGVPDGEQVPISLFNVKNSHIHASTVVRMERKWLPMQLVSRKTDGSWVTEGLGDGPPPVAKPLIPRTLVIDSPSARGPLVF